MNVSLFVWWEKSTRCFAVHGLLCNSTWYIGFHAWCKHVTSDTGVTRAGHDRVAVLTWYTGVTSNLFTTALRLRLSLKSSENYSLKNWEIHRQKFWISEWVGMGRPFWDVTCVTDCARTYLPIKPTFRMDSSVQLASPNKWTRPLLSLQETHQETWA